MLAVPVFFIFFISPLTLVKPLPVTERTQLPYRPYTPDFDDTPPNFFISLVFVSVAPATEFRVCERIGCDGYRVARGVVALLLEKRSMRRALESQVVAAATAAGIGKKPNFFFK